MDMVWSASALVLATMCQDGRWSRRPWPSCSQVRTKPRCEWFGGAIMAMALVVSIAAPCSSGARVGRVSVAVLC